MDCLVGLIGILGLDDPSPTDPMLSIYPFFFFSASTLDFDTCVFKASYFLCASCAYRASSFLCSCSFALAYFCSLLILAFSASFYFPSCITFSLRFYIFFMSLAPLPLPPILTTSSLSYEAL
jgi:hypothetical protein